MESSLPAQATQRPSIDVVVLAWNDGPLLDVAVESVLASEYVDARVVVVDNGSDEPVRHMWDDRVVVHREPTNLGVAAGRNRGAAMSERPLLCFLDSDAELSPRSLAVLAGALEEPDVAIAVPVFEDQDPEASAGRAPTLRVKIARGLGRRSSYEAVPRAANAQRWDVDFGIGACQLIRRVVFDAVGGLDGSIFYGPEDVDFCLRVSALGHRIVQVADTGVRHPPRRAFRRPLTVRGLRHGLTILRHAWRHRSFPRKAA